MFLRFGKVCEDHFRVPASVQMQFYGNLQLFLAAIQYKPGGIPVEDIKIVLCTNVYDMFLKAHRNVIMLAIGMIGGSAWIHVLEARFVFKSYLKPAQAY